MLAAITCVFTAFAFAELGGAIPVSGSSYSFAYAGLGERTAFLVGWCLLLEYGVSVSAVAVGWSQYVNELLDSVLGVQLPHALSAGPGDGSAVNLPAVIVIALACVLLVRGVRESARATAAMAVLKLAVLLAFCAIGFSAFRDGNLTPFSRPDSAASAPTPPPPSSRTSGSTPSPRPVEEAKNPRRDIPVAILVCIGLVTLLYCAVAVAAIGAVGGDRVGDRPAALSYVVDRVTGSAIGGGVVAFGAVVAIASVVLAVMYGQTRILLYDVRDGLIPRVFEKVSPRTATPVAGTLIVGVVFALPAAFAPLDAVGRPVHHRHSRHDGRRQRLGDHPAPPRTGPRPHLPRPAVPGDPAARDRLLPVPDVRDGRPPRLQFAVFLAVGLLVYTAYGRRGTPAWPGPRPRGSRRWTTLSGYQRGSLNQTALPASVGR
ncbi:amino acid permease [Streptomyces violaceorubidus]